MPSAEKQSAATMKYEAAVPRQLPMTATSMNDKALPLKRRGKPTEEGNDDVVDAKDDDDDDKKTRVPSALSIS